MVLARTVTWFLNHADLVLDTLEGAEIAGISVQLERRRGPAAQLRITTPYGSVIEPAAVSIRPQQPWLHAPQRDPMPFEFLDRGLQPEFIRPSLPILDLREIAAEKIAAFWRRRAARDLYDLEHLGRVLQADFDGPTIAALAALKIYFDVVDERLGRPLTTLDAIFGCTVADVTGADDLGRFRSVVTDVRQLLAQCASRYAALTALDADLIQLATNCSSRDRRRALQRRDELIVQLLQTAT